MGLGDNYLIASLVMLGAISLSNAARAEDASVALTPEEMRVRSLGREAERAFEAKDLKRSRELLLEAWEIRKSYDIAQDLAQTELELGNYAAATAYIAYATRQFPPSRSEQALLAIKAHFADLKSRVLTVYVAVEPRDATIRVDGVEQRPPLGPEVYVEPGRHRVEASAAGEKEESFVEGAAGEEKWVRLIVPEKKIAAAAVQPGGGLAPVAAMRPAETERSKASRVPLVIGGGLAVVGIGMGLGFHFATSAAKSNLARSRQGVPDETFCTRSSTASACSELPDLATKVDRYRAISTTSLFVGGAALLTTGGYWLWLETTEPSSPRAMVVPSFGPGWAGLDASAQF